ncbi:hypothetical protein ABIG06_001258 [Bradyrhizobium sp. USDA 326]|uniref:hypothetical protein n=1 Tax=unclassified Bradyrhizobium TaxID=2631580 RepID=UPI000F53B651|nr:hypothetical protein [Bradyrhizobium sp. RP6]RQH13971.1 hypothetical protein EHH60_09265 [Bradyrhizobium sp. RP6]
MRPPDFPNRTTFVIARLCLFARSSAAIDDARAENASKNDDYHTNWPKICAAIAAQIRERHGLTPRPRKYALPEISTLHRFASI